MATTEEYDELTPKRARELHGYLRAKSGMAEFGRGELEKYGHACGPQCEDYFAQRPLTASKGKWNPPIKSSDDVRPLLERMREALREDNRVKRSFTNKNMERVYVVLSEVAEMHKSVELAGGREWLAEQAELTVDQVRTALKNLERLGYLKTITPAEVTRYPLRKWIAERRRQGLGIPKLVRLRQEPPDPEVLDFLPDTKSRANSSMVLGDFALVAS